MKPTVFISREITTSSDFYKILHPLDYSITGKSLLNFQAIPFVFHSTIDWVFFYSQNAVKFFFQQLKTQLPSTTQYAAIGKKTAHILSYYSIIPQFIGTGKPEETAKAFLNLAQGQRVLFPRAKNSRQSIQRILQKQIKDIDLVVYDNVPKTNFDIPNCDILVFTSPLGAQTYFNKKSLFAHQKVIAIGHTTAQSLKDLNIPNIIVATEATEKGLAETVIQNRSFE